MPDPKSPLPEKPLDSNRAKAGQFPGAPSLQSQTRENSAQSRPRASPLTSSTLRPSGAVSLLPRRATIAASMAILDINEIRAILPHRYPFLLVDRIVELEPERIVGIKQVTANEPSPTAKPTRLVDPERISPAASTPGTVVSSGHGSRSARGHNPERTTSVPVKR